MAKRKKSSDSPSPPDHPHKRDSEGLPAADEKVARPPVGGLESADSSGCSSSSPPGAEYTVSTPENAEDAGKILDSLSLPAQQREFIGELFQRVYRAFDAEADVKYPPFLRAVDGQARVARIFSRHQAHSAPDRLVGEVAPNLRALINEMLEVPLPSKKTGRRVSLHPHPAHDFKTWFNDITRLCPSIFFPTDPDQLALFSEAIDLKALLTADVTLLGDAYQRFQRIVISLLYPTQKQEIEWAQAVNEALYIGTNPNVVQTGLLVLVEKIKSARSSFQAFLAFRKDLYSDEPPSDLQTRIFGRMKRYRDKRFPHQILISFLLFGVRGLFGTSMNNQATVIPGFCLLTELMTLRDAPPPEPIWINTQRFILSVIVDKEVDKDVELFSSTDLATVLRQDFLSFCSSKLTSVPSCLPKTHPVKFQIPAELMHPSH